MLKYRDVPRAFSDVQPNVNVWACTEISRYLVDSSGAVCAVWGTEVIVIEKPIVKWLYADYNQKLENLFCL